MLVIIFKENLIVNQSRKTALSYGTRLSLGEMQMAYLSIRNTKQASV